MPILNGEKFACESCIKGHRVSGCTHLDRPLKHINPKGRPVKQCDHCQKARKNKSHHARCDCGPKKDKTKAEKAAHESENHHDGSINIGSSLNFVATSTGCKCHSGEKCICGIKKEPGDLKLDTGFPKTGALLNKNKPRLTTAHSETTLTVFANGHHKPCHRLNNMAHTSGAPYKIPRHNTHHGSVHRSHDNLAEVYSKSMDPARRSVDSLNLTNSTFNFFPQQTTSESVPITPLAAGLENDNAGFDPSKYLFNTQQQTAYDKMPGETTMAPSVTMSESMPVNQYSWMNNNVFPGQQYGMDSISTSPTGDLTPEYDLNTLTSAAADIHHNPYPWSAGDLPLDPNKLSDSLQPVSHSGESNRQSVPGMTTSSSGAQSEVGEPALFGDLDFSKIQQQPSFGEPPAYQLGSAAVSQQDLHQQMPNSISTNSHRQSLDLDFLSSSNSTAVGQQGMDVFGTSALDDASLFQTAGTTGSSGFTEGNFATTADFAVTLNSSQGGMSTTADDSAWMDMLGGGLNVNSFPVPIDSMNGRTGEFPSWL
ncbi:hypothetical protein BKA81DRAFT_94452 [Phyllosticta paracitricarpa]|uniref:Copper-fist domain-containing protein n=2 Tax=Phyllosticta TaxID=121621 RepID=A0ABR1MCV9_9PEZI